MRELLGQRVGCGKEDPTGNGGVWGTGKLGETRGLCRVSRMI